MRIKPLVALLVALWVATIPVAAQTLLPIGTIQGVADVSPYLNRFVNFRGVVVGRYEDENTRGDIYYTLFVQDLPEETDGDPATSDGIAVFLGRESRPEISIGAQVWVGGKVTEFYGLTEIDDEGLILTVEKSAVPIAEPVVIDPPRDMSDQAVYFEALEGMRVAYDDAVIIAGPTHEGCGFAVIGESEAPELPVIRREDADPVGQVVPVLYPSDLNCDGIAQVKVGDRIVGLAGTLTYNFDQFKIVMDGTAPLTLSSSEVPDIPILMPLGPDQISVASINAEDYFDTVRDTDEEGEPVLTEEELAARQVKLAYVINHVLNCPTLIALQEVEHEALLADLSGALEESCGFRYQVSHLESPDARGIDNGLLSDSRRVKVDNVTLRQTCSPVPTAIKDLSVTCPAGEEPLFGRPPLQIDARIDGKSYVILINHFKSKRGGEIETGLERIRQAVYVNALATGELAADSAARLIVLGDLNDTDQSPTLALLTDPAQGGALSNVLAAITESHRYSYNFGGVSELIDAILVSPALVEDVSWATIVHTNTDYPVGWRLDTSPERLPFRVTDHDIPIVALGQLPPTPAPLMTATPQAMNIQSTVTEQAPAVEPSTSVQQTVISSPNAPSEVTVVATASVSPDSQGVPTRAIRPVLLGAALILLVAFILLRTRR